MGLTTTGAENTALSHDALVNNTTGSNNVALGRSALFSNTTASNNTAVGYQAGYNNTTGGYNVAVGYRSIFGTSGSTTGSDNVSVGNMNIHNLTSGAQNIALGTYSLYENTTGSNNIAISGGNAVAGSRGALAYNTSGTGNIAIGFQSLFSNTTSVYNVGIGYNALRANTTASNNTALGAGAGVSTQTGDSNTFIGQDAGYYTVGNRNTFVGRQAGLNSNLAATQQNTFVGTFSGRYVTSGAKNTILGAYDGNQGGLDIRTSSNNIVLSDGDGNPRVYVDSAGNVMIGPSSSAYPSVSGITMSRVGLLTVSRDGGLPMGLNRGQNDGSILNFRRSSTVVASVSVTASSTAYNTSSDHRLKENVVELTGATTRLKQLEPKRFNFIADADTTVDGFIAHEVQTVVPEAITGTHNEVDDDGNPVYQGIDQSKLVPLLVATIKELEARITALENA